MDRRKFIKNAGAIVSLPILLNGQALQAYGALGGFSPEQTDGKILVLIQLDGGNDGLNTLIPLNMYDNLVKVRPEVVLPKNKILPLTDLQGLHPSMTEIKELYNQEKLMFIQNVGYPQPNLSHFRSKEIVLSASDSKTAITSGWFGRYIEKLHPAYPENYPSTENPHPLAITIGNSSSPTCQGELNPAGIVLKNLNTNYVSQSDETQFPDTPYGYELDYITQVMKSTEKYLEVVSESAEKADLLSEKWTNNRLANELKIVAQLIAGGLNTPIYVVNLGGFDTHANQVIDGQNDTGKHADLMRYVSEAVFAFQDELKLHNKEENVLSLVYSEFGRRMGSNKSNGTDHGEAYPMMLLGSQVNPVVFGENPEIPEQVEKKTNVPMKIDFRSVYASILNQWFRLPKSEIKTILNDDFEILPILKTEVSSENEASENRKQNNLSIFPNPVTEQAQIRFYASGGEVSLNIYALDGKKIRTILNGNFPRGNQLINFSGKDLKNGQYVLVLQDKNKRVSQTIIKQ